MFYGDHEDSAIVEMPEDSPEAFRVALRLVDSATVVMVVGFRYIYTDEADLTDENVHQVLRFCNKHLLTRLGELCVEYMKPSLNTANVLSIIEEFETLTGVQEMLI